MVTPQLLNIFAGNVFSDVHPFHVLRKIISVFPTPANTKGGNDVNDVHPFHVCVKLLHELALIDGNVVIPEQFCHVRTNKVAELVSINGNDVSDEHSFQESVN